MPEFVTREVADADRAAQEVAVYEASEKLMYASILGDEPLKQQAKEDMLRARNMTVRFTEEGYNRVKERLIANDPHGSYVAGLISDIELQEAISRAEAHISGAGE